MELVRTSFDIPKELHATFKSACATLNVDMKNIIREIINKWLMKQEKVITEIMLLKKEKQKRGVKE